MLHLPLLKVVSSASYALEGMFKQGYGEIDIFCLLVYFPDGCSDQGCAKLKPGARGFVLVSHVGAQKLKHLIHPPLHSQTHQQYEVKWLGPTWMLTL